VGDNASWPTLSGSWVSRYAKQSALLLVLIALIAVASLRSLDEPSVMPFPMLRRT
jgi:hypothetical protein